MALKQPVYPFIVVLRNGNARLVRLAGTLLGILSIVMLTLRGLSSEGSGLNLITAAICLVFSSWNIAEMRRGRPSRQTITLALAGACMLLAPPFSWGGLLLLVLARIEVEALKPTEIGFSTEHIRVGGWIPRKYPWMALRNVVLLDGMLTLDFSDNRLFQRETDDLDDDAYDGTEDEFNAFCRQQLNATHPASGQ